MYSVNVNLQGAQKATVIECNDPQRHRYIFYMILLLAKIHSDNI